MNRRKHYAIKNDRGKNKMKKINEDDNFLFI
jgi:hypothetical protein